MRNIINLLSTILNTILGINNEACFHFQNVAIGETYYVYSPNYPFPYSSPLNCRWIAVCPDGHNCEANCTDIALPYSSSCSRDKLLITTTGDVELENADIFCGTGTTVITSTERTITIGLSVPRNSIGGKFLCELRAVPNKCSCGYKKRTRIVGGNETDVNEYPMMAGLRIGNSPDVTCGAVIIDKRYVLTAAHCLVNSLNDAFRVLVGEHDLDTASETDATSIYEVENIIIHPQYNRSVQEGPYDIAILRTSKDMKFGDKVGPACLPFNLVNTDLVGSNVTIIGWGTTSFGGPRSDKLLEVEVGVVDQDTCQQSSSSVTPLQFCTYADGRDACQNDSGGPVLYADPDTGLLYNVGIVSYGELCAGAQPAVHTRVISFLDWIVANTPDAAYCRK